MKIIGIQAIFIVVIALILFMLYPKTNLSLEGNIVKFDSENTDVIILSENPDFSNSRYIEIEKGEEMSFELPPGKYYWKSSNNLIIGLKGEFEIKSEVGLEIERKENESDLVNIGNVKINVTKTKEGVMVGHIILEPEEEERIEDENEEYIGGQTE